MKKHLSSPAVLILGAAPRIAVPIARILRERCSTPVDVAGLYAGDRPLLSRVIRSFTVLPDFRTSPAKFSDALLSLVREKQIDTIIPVQDRALAAIAANHHLLTAFCHIASPPPHVVERALNKELTLQIAESCGIEVPRGYCVCNAADAENIAPLLRFPVVLKPAEAKYSGPLKARSFPGREELLSWLETHRDASRYLVQEYCPGEGVGIELLMHRGECLACFQHRRLKEHPPSGGVAVIAISELPDAQLVDAAQRLLRAMEWEGVAMVEFRRNPENRSSALMEVNGRYWGTTALPLFAGIEFPVYQWQLLHGRTPAVPDSYRTGLRWRWTAGYIARTHRLLSSPDSAAPGLSRWQELAQLPLDLSPLSRDALWSFFDPFAGWHENASTIWELLKNDGKALFQFARRRLQTLTRLISTICGWPVVYLQQGFAPQPHRERKASKQIRKPAQSFLFVGRGTKMESAICAALFERELTQRGLENIRVASAETDTTDCTDSRLVQITSESGVFLDVGRSQPLTPELVRNAEVIFATDAQSQGELLVAYPAAERKIFLLSCCTKFPLQAADGRNPWLSELELTEGWVVSLSTCIKNLVADIFPHNQQRQGINACATPSTEIHER